MTVVFGVSLLEQSDFSLRAKSTPCWSRNRTSGTVGADFKFPITAFIKHLNGIPLRFLQRRNERELQLTLAARLF